MTRPWWIFLTLAMLVILHEVTIVSGFNPIVFVKNWSLRGSAAFPMPKNFMDTHKLITREGYGWESYPVTTADDYILRLTRIVPRENFVGRRLPVLMVHGVLATSEAWVTRGRSQDLAFQLTEMGFDVWLADLRGCHYAKRHKYLSPNDPRFWDFTFHESGVYDIPAFVDFILAKTGEQKIAYIGHSMGTTVFFTFASVRSEYNKKLWAAIMLAPVAAKFPFEEIYNPAIRIALNQYDLFYGTVVSAGIYEILPRTPKLVYNVKKYCTKQPEQDYCLDFFGQFYGEHRANLDRKHFGEQVSHLPAGSSAKTLHHLAQVFHHGFHMYDYGPRTNKLKYNSTTPPFYPLTRITAPTMLFYGENDPLTSAQGTNFLATMIPGVKRTKLVSDHKFTHTDFVLGLNTNRTLYGDMIQFLMKQAAVA